MKIPCEECGKLVDQSELNRDVKDFNVCQSCSSQALDFDDIPEDKNTNKPPTVSREMVVKAVMTSKLITLVSNLPLEEKETLLIELEKKADIKRRFDRKDCIIEVDYVSNGKLYKDYIRNISATGLFIETRRKLAINDPVELILNLPHLKKPVKLSCQVERIAPNGMGVIFNDVGQNLANVLNALIENMESKK